MLLVPSQLTITVAQYLVVGLASRAWLRQRFFRFLASFLHLCTESFQTALRQSRENTFYTFTLFVGMIHYSRHVTPIGFFGGFDRLTSGLDQSIVSVAFIVSIRSQDHRSATKLPLPRLPFWRDPALKPGQHSSKCPAQSKE